MAFSFLSMAGETAVIVPGPAPSGSDRLLAIRGRANACPDTIPTVCPALSSPTD